MCVVRGFADLNASLRKLGFRKTSNSRKSLFRNCAKSRWLKQHDSRRRAAEFRICRVESATGVKTNDFWSRYGGQFQAPGKGPEMDTGEHFLAPCSADFFSCPGSVFGSPSCADRRLAKRYAHNDFALPECSRGTGFWRTFSSSLGRPRGENSEPAPEAELRAFRGLRFGSRSGQFSQGGRGVQDRLLLSHFCGHLAARPVGERLVLNRWGYIMVGAVTCGDVATFGLQLLSRSHDHRVCRDAAHFPSDGDDVRRNEKASEGANLDGHRATI